MPLGDKGEDWATISLKQWLLEMKEQVPHHMFISPVGIWEILMEWNQGIKNQRHKLRIGNTGNAGAGNHAINALGEVIDGVV